MKRKASKTKGPRRFAPVTGSADFTTLAKHWEECAAKEPDHRTEVERALLEDMFKFYDALQKLGWHEAIYCPKDGTIFLAIEAGSTGVFECSYDGEWPKGTWWIHSAGDMWPSRPILWKPLPPNEQAQTLRLKPEP